MQHSAGSPACTAAPSRSEDISFAKFDTSGIPRAGKKLKQAPKAERRAFGRLSRDVQNEDGHLGRGLGILLQLRGNPIEELAEHVRPIQTQALVKVGLPLCVLHGGTKVPETRRASCTATDLPQRPVTTVACSFQELILSRISWMTWHQARHVKPAGTNNFIIKEATQVPKQPKHLQTPMP